MTHCKDILASYKAKTRDNFEIAVETAQYCQDSVPVTSSINFIGN